jgi:hypothetical protein
VSDLQLPIHQRQLSADVSGGTQKLGFADRTKECE